MTEKHLQEFIETSKELPLFFKLLEDGRIEISKRGNKYLIASSDYDRIDTYLRGYMDGFLGR